MYSFPSSNAVSTSRSPATIGDEKPLGAATFHFTFVSGPSSTGGRWPSATPEPPGPAPELKRFERLIGHYTGKGTATMEHGKAPIDWTCKSTYAWTLGNHFVSVDSIVDFGSAMPPLAFRELLGWDREGQRYVAIGVSNEGEGFLNEIVFPTWVVGMPRR